MPAKYEAIKAQMLAKGESETAAKTSAAKIFNATRKQGEPSLNAYVQAEKHAQGKRRGTR